MIIQRFRGAIQNRLVVVRDASGRCLQAFRTSDLNDVDVVSTMLLSFLFTIWHNDVSVKQLKLLLNNVDHNTIFLKLQLWINSDMRNVIWSWTQSDRAKDRQKKKNRLKINTLGILGSLWEKYRNKTSWHVIEHPTQLQPGRVITIFSLMRALKNQGEKCFWTHK